MSNFTYEYKNTSRALETFEWDSTWHEHTELLSEDGVHWQAEGYRYLAQAILSTL